MNNIYSLGKKLNIKDLCKESGLNISEEEMKERVSGQMCMCPENESMFVLLPKDHPSVIEGGKRYMMCLKCGCGSHL